MKNTYTNKTNSKKGTSKQTEEKSAFDVFKKKKVKAEDFKHFKKKSDKDSKYKTATAKVIKAFVKPKIAKVDELASPTPKKKGTSQIELNAPIRLNKFLSESGVCARRKADEYISQGAVKVNGKIVTELGTKVLTSDFITVNGDPIPERSRMIYIILNKPKDVITSTNDEFDRTTIMDIVKKDARIYPVGRLDRNTTGVILLTNDGELAHRLTHPSYEIERIYNVKLDKPLQFGDAKQISEGVELEDGKTSPCNVSINPLDPTKIILTLTEGRNREVRRIFEEVGYIVKQLERKYFAGLSVKGLGRGDYRHLTKYEIIDLKNQVKLI